MAGSASTISSKGQITLHLKVRQRLGLKPGDKVQFVEEGSQTVLRPASSDDENPFTKLIGALPPLPGGVTSAEWVRQMRDPDDAA